MADASNPWGRTPPAKPPRMPRRWRPIANVAIAVLLVGYVLAVMGRDLMRPTGFSFLRDLYLKPSLNAVVRRGPDGKAIVAISGEIGSAAAPWFYGVITGNQLRRGDTILLSSPGGNVDTALALGRTIRAHGFDTAVGRLAADGGIAPSYCASACVFVYAGGVDRRDIVGSRLGVHRFTMSEGDGDVAEAQRMMGVILGYLDDMGIKASLAAEASKSDSIRWLDPDAARAMDLVTGPPTDDGRSRT